MSRDRKPAFKFNFLSAWVGVAFFAIVAPGLSATGEAATRASRAPAATFGARPAAFESLPSCEPISEFIESSEPGATLAFCAEWDPEFRHRGFQCCMLPPKQATKRGRRSRNRNRCAPERVLSNYCGERTAAQVQYKEAVTTGKAGDLLGLISSEVELKGKQAWCNVNFGFLVDGREIIPTGQNRVLLRSPDRCTNFGTDRMTGMIEWIGRQIAGKFPAPEYAGTRLLIGDVAAPRGGCLSGRGGRMGHSSHTSGQDADIGFLRAKPGQNSPQNFDKQFDADTQWWLIKQILENPFACVKVMFLDRKLIGKLARAAGKDPMWPQYRRFIRHIKGHKNHVHVRIGDHVGPPGCDPGFDPELEVEDAGEVEASESAPFEQLMDEIEDKAPAVTPPAAAPQSTKDM